MTCTPAELLPELAVLILHYFVPAILAILLTITASFCVVYYLKLYLESK